MFVSVLCAVQESAAPLRPTARDDSESPAERFSRRTAPFSGSDQVSAVVKLSLFGRKNSKHEPMKAAHPSACILSCSRQERPVLCSSFLRFLQISLALKRY